MSNDLPQLPAVDDIQDLLRFEYEEGRIWLADERMVLLRSSELQALRRELIESLGMDRAKGLLIRMGYIAGRKDAALGARFGVAEAYGVGVTEDFPGLYRWFRSIRKRPGWAAAYPTSFIGLS